MSAAIWSEPPEAHPGLPSARLSRDALPGRIDARNDPTRHRISTYAGELRKGDILRDVGIERTVARIEPVTDLVSDVIVHFEHDPVHPDAPDHLGFPGETPVTAWRAT